MVQWECRPNDDDSNIATTGTNQRTHLTGVFPESYAELLPPSTSAPHRAAASIPSPRPRPALGKSSSLDNDEVTSGSPPVVVLKPPHPTRPAPPVKPPPPSRPPAPQTASKQATPPAPASSISIRTQIDRPDVPIKPQRFSAEPGVSGGGVSAVRPPPPAGPAPARVIPPPPAFAPPPAKR